MKKYKFHLFDIRNNNFKIVENQHLSDENMIFQWQENNYSCDCNRYPMMYNKEENDSDYCNSENYILLLMATDENDKPIIYSKAYLRKLRIAKILNKEVQII